MTETPPEEPTPLDPLHAALLKFTGCVGEALEDICSYGLTLGDSYVPFLPDPEDLCEEDEAICSQAWVRVTDTQSTASQAWGGDCAGVLSLSLEVGVLRCIEVAEDGEAPTASEVMLAALQSMTDMKALYCAAMACDAWEAIQAGSWSPYGPEGGQYGGTWTFTVEV